MRIGDLDYLDKTKASADRDSAGRIKPSDAPKPTPGQERRAWWKNWWYYYKWYVICGVILLGIMVNVLGSYLGWWVKAPDIQIAYVGKTELPPDTVSALERAFASIASDFNGDGEIIVKVNQYISGLQNADPDTSYYQYASEISLIGDIADCESYFFLMDDPDKFQHDFQLLAAPDGSCPGDTDFAVEDKVIPWASCDIFSGMELGGYTTSFLGKKLSGSNQELLSGLFIGRRCFFTGDRTEHVEECGELWERLYGNSD